MDELEADRRQPRSESARNRPRCGRLFELGRLAPVLSTVYSLGEVGEAARLVQQNRHTGKVGVLCLAPEEGLGVTDPRLRERIGAAQLNPLRNL